MILALSWALCVFTISGIELVGRKQRVGFLVGIAAQVPWLVFDALTGAYGLMPLALILGWRYWVAYRRWEVI